MKVTLIFTVCFMAGVASALSLYSEDVNKVDGKPTSIDSVDHLKFEDMLQMPPKPRMPEMPTMYLARKSKMDDMKEKMKDNAEKAKESSETAKTAGAGMAEQAKEKMG